MKRILSIAIDGPAGSGKSTVADLVAQKLGIYHLDTGAMYRAFGYAAMQNGIPCDSRNELIKMLENTDIEVSFDDNKKQHVFVNGNEVTDNIRTNEVSMAASTIATVPEVREKLVKLQREIAASQSVVLDGRDICEHVLPNADVKVYLTADASERARRRLLELQAKGQEVNKTLTEMTCEIEARDRQDMERKASPLTIAKDAEVIDSTNLSVEQVCDIIIKMTGEEI